MDTGRLKRVLIIKPSSLGDVIDALPVAAAVKAAVPGVGIDWVVGAAYAGIVDACPDVDRAIVFDRGMLRGPGRAGRLWGFVRELRRFRYDIVMDLQGLLRSGLMSLACRADKRAGFENAREGSSMFYTDRVSVPSRAVHAVDRYLLVPARFGISPEAGPEFNLSFSAADAAEADSVLSDAGIAGGDCFIAVAPSARWTTKRWPAENFVKVTNRLVSERGIKSVFVGSGDDAVLIEASGERPSQENVSAFGKTSVTGLAQLIKRARLLVTNDSGPMHVAAAVGTPTVAIFGPTDPVRTGPYGAGHEVVTAGIGCAPCFRKRCDDVVCLDMVSPERVYEAVLGMLG